MKWELTWGAQVDFLKQVEEMTGKTPPALLDRPTLDRHLWYYRDIFDEVAGSRHYAAGGEPLPIPISEIMAYCSMFGISGTEERETLFKRIRALDRAFLDVMREKAQKRNASGDKKPAPAVDR